jgi:hypothetical protein
MLHNKAERLAWRAVCASFVTVFESRKIFDGKE